MKYTCWYCNFVFRWPPYQDNKLRPCCCPTHRDISNSIITRKEN